MCVEIYRDDLRHFHIYVGVAEECAAQIEGHIVGSEDCGGDLVEQRLELMIVVLVEQRDPNIRVCSELAGTVQPGETTPHNHDVFCAVRNLID